MLRIIAGIAAAILAVSAAFADPGDVEGSADYPGLGRFAGSVITGYQAEDFDDTVVQAAAFKDGKAVDARAVEGRVLRIAYRSKPGASTLEVLRNFRDKALAGGFEKLLECETDACGGMDFAGGVDVLPMPMMWFDGFNYRYFSARKPATATSPETYLAVAVSPSNDEIYAQATIVEAGAMQDKMVDAAAMKKGLAENGRIALYGIYFDTAKADVKPESRPTLAEIAALLKDNPQLATIYIVGHTDSQGALDYNMDLSRRRAEAIANELAAAHGVARTRLKTAGVAFLAPVASNATDAGRALNRRTELVAP